MEVWYTLHKINFMRKETLEIGGGGADRLMGEGQVENTSERRVRVSQLGWGNK